MPEATVTIFLVRGEALFKFQSYFYMLSLQRYLSSIVLSVSYIFSEGYYIRPGNTDKELYSERSYIYSLSGSVQSFIQHQHFDQM